MESRITIKRTSALSYYRRFSYTSPRVKKYLEWIAGKKFDVTGVRAKIRTQGTKFYRYSQRIQG